MEFRITFYQDAQGRKPLLAFLANLRQAHPSLEKLVTAGLTKLRQRAYHGPPLTELVDPEDDIFELRVGHADIARVFFLYQPGQEIVVTHGYVKKTQKRDIHELARAHTYK